jgi:hypothetical protein
MLAIALLIIGIIGFVKGRISVTKNRELRGGGMYAVATLFCLPLPLSFLIGLALGAQAASSGKQVDQQTVLIAGLAATWAPIVVAFILAFAMAKPKVVPGQPPPQGFQVKM